MREIVPRLKEGLQEELDEVLDKFYGEGITPSLEHEVKYTVYNLFMKWYMEGRLDPLTEMDGMRDMPDLEIRTTIAYGAGRISISFYERERGER